MLHNPYFLLIITPLIWAGNTIASRLAVGEIAPMTLVFFRWFFAVMVLIPFILPHLKKDWEAIKKGWYWFCVYGCLGFVVFNLLFYAAAHYTTAIHLTLIQSSIPMIILLINGFVFRQGFALFQIIGVLITVIGVLLTITHGDVSILKGMDFNIGDLLMLLACISYSMYSIMLRYKPAVSWLTFIFLSGCVALLSSIPFACYEALTTEGPVITISVKSVLLLLYVAVIVSVISQVAFAKGVSIVGSSRAGFAINLVPVFGMILAVLILGESLYWYHIAGLLLVFGGIALSEHQASKQAKQKGL